MDLVVYFEALCLSVGCWYGRDGGEKRTGKRVVGHSFFYKSVDVRIDINSDTHRQWINVLRFDVAEYFTL